MYGKDKLKEAEDFLEKIKKYYQQEVRDEFLFDLSAFLSSVRSVPDYLLEGYNLKYSLNIPLSDKLYPSTFEKEAKQSHNSDAILFIKWWKNYIKNLQTDPIFSLLKSKRDISIHRKQIKPDLAKLEIKETIHLSDSIKIQKYDQEGRLIETFESEIKDVPKAEKSEVTFNWFFSEYEREPVINVCEKYLNIMKKFVKEAELKFP